MVMDLLMEVNVILGLKLMQINTPIMVKMKIRRVTTSESIMDGVVIDAMWWLAYILLVSCVLLACLLIACVLLACYCCHCSLRLLNCRKDGVVRINNVLMVCMSWGGSYGLLKWCGCGVVWVVCREMEMMSVRVRRRSGTIRLWTGRSLQQLLITVNTFTWLALTMGRAEWLKNLGSDSPTNNLLKNFGSNT